MASPLITTRFTAQSTADDVLEGVDVHGLRTVVTGASSGLGAETARALAAHGASVVLAVRDTAAGAVVAERIARATGSRPEVRPLDLADPASIEAFTAGWDGPLHRLVANAGVVTAVLERTVDGRELQFATNHLGHHVLASRLRGALAQAAPTRHGARVVVVSSTAHMRSGIDFDDVDFIRRPYDPQTAYAQSKTANSLFAVEATRRWGADGIVANTVNPGGIATGLQRHFSPAQRASLDAAEAAGVFSYKTVEEGAATTMVAAVAPEFALTGGHYLDDGTEAYTVPDDAAMADHPHGVKAWALDPASAQRLWRLSDELTGAR